MQLNSKFEILSCTTSYSGLLIYHLFFWDLWLHYYYGEHFSCGEILLRFLFFCKSGNQNKIWRPHSAVSTANNTRKCAAIHFGMLFVDIIDIPFALCALVVILTGWRAVAFVKNFKIAMKISRAACRKTALKQFALWLLDIPTFFAFGFVIITVYRASYMIHGLQQWFASQSWTSTPEPVSVNNDTENPVCCSSIFWIYCCSSLLSPHTYSTSTGIRMCGFSFVLYLLICHSQFCLYSHCGECPFV